MIVAAFCAAIGFLSRNLSAPSLGKYAFIAGVVLDCTSLLTRISYLYTIGLVLHLLLLAAVFVSLRSGIPRISYALAGTIFAFSFLGVPVCARALVCAHPPSYNSETSATLIVDGYKGFNVVLHNRTYYAIPQSEGIFSMARILSGGYSQYYAGDSVSTVEQKIDQSHLSVPVLVAQDYRGYNVVLYNGTYYAILQTAGAFDIQKAEAGGYYPYFLASSLDAIKHLIDLSLAPP
jgi:hypothetical protein